MGHETLELDILVHHNLHLFEKVGKVDYTEPQILWDEEVDTDKEFSDSE